jgi:hypothetical protein
VLKRDYEQIMKNDLQRIGYSLLSFESNQLQNNGRNIDISLMSAEKPNGEPKFIKSGYTFINSDFIEFNVISSDKEDFYASKLFDAVLTDLTYKGKKVYNPFHSNPNDSPPY